MFHRYPVWIPDAGSGPMNDNISAPVVAPDPSRGPAIAVHVGRSRVQAFAGRAEAYEVSARASVIALWRIMSR